MALAMDFFFRVFKGLEKDGSTQCKFLQKLHELFILLKISNAIFNIIFILIQKLVRNRRKNA